MIAPARFPDGVEIRTALELRAAEGRSLEGRAAVFGIPARIGRFHEVITRGAFAASLAAGKDVLALVDHDPSRLLARTRSGTLHLAEDDEGLAFRISLPDTSLGRDVLALAERGDLGGASIGFRAVEERWIAADRRELRAVNLEEISIVLSRPAYETTSVHARAQHMAQAGLNVRARRIILDRM